MPGRGDERLRHRRSIDRRPNRIARRGKNHAVVKRGGRRLVLRQLRHSCIVQLARAGCTVPEIASITGHSIASVGRILSVYLPRDSTVARNAQMKRGIVRDENAA